MLVVEHVGLGDEILVPTVLTRLVAAEQKNRATARVKREEHALGPSRMLHTKFLHTRVTGEAIPVGMGTG